MYSQQDKQVKSENLQKPCYYRSQGAMDRKVIVHNEGSVCISWKTQCAAPTKTNW